MFTSPEGSGLYWMRKLQELVCFHAYLQIADTSQFIKENYQKYRQCLHLGYFLLKLLFEIDCDIFGTNPVDLMPSVSMKCLWNYLTIFDNLCNISVLSITGSYTGNPKNPWIDRMLTEVYLIPCAVWAFKTKLGLIQFPDPFIKKFSKLLME